MQNDKRPLNQKGHCTVQLARSVLLTYVDFTVVLPGKILFGICFSAANCCVTDLEDKAGDDHDQNGDISHLAWAKTRPSTTSTASSPMPVRAQPPALQLKPAVEPGHGIPVPNHHHCKPFSGGRSGKPRNRQKKKLEMRWVFSDHPFLDVVHIMRFQAFL